MADMDLDELFDGPAQAPARPTRFAPKGSKFKPKPKNEPSEPHPPPASNPSESLPVPKKEFHDTKPDIGPKSGIDENEMDVDVKPGVKEEGGGDLMDTEAVDDVVREIEVYFTPPVDDNSRFYVLQYPLRPVWRPYELDDLCEEVRVKPESAEVEVDLAVDVDSKNYDLDADPRVKMRKQTLAASWKPPNTTGYAVGILAGNKLHLNPVQAVVQLRPSMKHLNSKESVRNKVAPSNVEDMVKSEEHHEGKPSGSSKKLGKMSEEIKDSEEGWIPLKYHTLRSNMAAEYQQKMITREGSEILFSMSSHDYLNSLCPGTSNDNISSKGPSRRFLQTLPLKERLKTWLVEGPPVHRFDALKHLAPEESVEEVLVVLQEYARLVQGLWVPKSSLVYGTDQGIEVLARDYVFVLFNKNVTVNNSQIPQKLAKAMKEVLKLVAVERSTFSDWKLKELPDLSFIKLNPSVVKKQEEEWECSGKRVTDLLRGKHGPGMKSNTTNPAASKNSNQATTRTPNEANSSTALPQEDAITKALHNFFKNVKICSFQEISQRLRDMAVSEKWRPTGSARTLPAANSIDAFPDRLQAIISQVAVNIHGIWVPKSSPDNPQYDPFRKVVIDLFIAGGPNAKLKKATILEAAKMELKREISQNEYQKVLQELCLSQDSGWVLRRAGGNSKH